MDEITAHTSNETSSTAERTVMKMNYILKQLILLNQKEKLQQVSYKENYKSATIELQELLI